MLAARPRPRLVVLCVVEQFRADYLERFGNAFAANGLRRLLERGAYFPDCQMACSTFSASGLATISTGAYPDLHGIVADRWYDRGVRTAMPATLAGMRATTLSEQFMQSSPKNRSFAAGLDYEHCALLLGRGSGGIYAMDDRGRFNVHGGEQPAWLEAFNSENAAENFRDKPWTALGPQVNPPALRVLEFDPERPENFHAAYRASPFAQSAQLSMARELIAQEKLGGGPGADLLILALGSMDLLGYDTGGDSVLMREMVLQLDREIELLLGTLDKLIPEQNYAFAFTAAHGAPRAPDPARRPKLAMQGDTVGRALNGALSAKYDIGSIRNRYVERFLYPFVYLSRPESRRHDLELSQLRAAAGEAALGLPGVAGYYTGDGNSSFRGEWLRRFRNSFHAVRSGDLMLAYHPDCVEDYGEGRGISYGSLYNYDTRVPLIFFGPLFFSDTIEAPVEAVDIAPTLARGAGVGWPSSSTGRVLGEAFAPEAR